MAVKGEHHRQRFILLGIGQGLPDDLLVTQMHAIEDADGHADLPARGSQLRRRVENVHAVSLGRSSARAIPNSAPARRARLLIDTGGAHITVPRMNAWQPAVGLIRLCALLSLSAAGPAAAANFDWYRWRGPDLNGVSKEADWSASWPSAGPDFPPSPWPTAAPTPWATKATRILFIAWTAAPGARFGITPTRPGWMRGSTTAAPTARQPSMGTRSTPWDAKANCFASRPTRER